MENDNDSRSAKSMQQYSLAMIVIPLLKGVVYQEAAPEPWQALLENQAAVRDYVAVLGLDLILNEAEGYAFLRSRPDDDDDDDKPRIPRLIVRRQLSFPVSLLLALLRKKLAEFDAGGDETRLVLSRDDIIELIRVFLPETSNEARLIDQVDVQITKVVELGFLRSLRGQERMFEVRRILKSYVDAQWLSDFDERLSFYRSHVLGEQEGTPDE